MPPLRNSASLVVTAALLASPCAAQSSAWRKIGSNAQYVTAILSASEQPSTLYATTDSAIFRTDSGGNAWVDISQGLSPAPIGGTVRYLLLAIDPSGAKTAYVSAGQITSDFRRLTPVLFKTTDGGGSWIPIFSGNVYSLAVDPHDSACLYAATGAGLLRSTDGGVRWMTVRSDVATAVTVDPSAPLTVYAAIGDNGILKSLDGGETWTSAGFPSGYADRLLVAADRPGTVYATTTNPYGRPFFFPISHLYRSDDAGVTWISLVSDVGHLQSLILDPTSWHVIYLVNGGILSRSVDGGFSWHVIPFASTQTGPTSLDLSADGSTLYAGAGTEGAFALTVAGRPIGRPEPPRRVPFR